MSVLENLCATGLTRHEAQLYILLSSEGLMTGYEASKQSGISRSNAYLALAGLVSKGAAMSIDGEATRYAALPVQEFCDNNRRHFERILDEIQTDMPAQSEMVEPFLTIRGKVHILDKIRNLISQTEQRIYLSLASAELQMILPDLSALIRQGKKVVLITSAPVDLPGATVYLADKKPGQIRMIADSSKVLTGDLTAREHESSCLYTQHKAVVSLVKESMINEISLIKLDIQAS